MSDLIKRNKFYIAVDLEGVACCVGAPGGLSSSPNYKFACEQASREAASAARALFDMGAAEVIVWDNHGRGVNLDYLCFDKRCRFSIGSGKFNRFPLLDETFAGILYIGYHAYDSVGATLSHAYSSATFQYIKINGKQVGEANIDAAVAGKLGVPLIFASSDDICLAQIKKDFPDIITVETKKSTGWNSAVSKHPYTVIDEIYDGVVKTGNLKRFPKPYMIDEPFQFEIRFKRIEAAETAKYKNPDGTPFKQIDAYTLKGTLRSFDEIL